MRRRASRLKLAAVALVLPLSACTWFGTDDSSVPDRPPLTIFAAASLSASFTELAGAFAAEHADVEVKPIVYDGSATLATQLFEGAMADVFASADERTMSRVAKAGLLASDASVFATNALQIAVEPGNPHRIDSLADLNDPDLAVVLCAPQVPCGDAAHRLLELAGVSLAPASEEQNVTAVATKVRLGEADAGLVYATDVVAAGGAIEGVPIPNAEQARNRNPIAVPASAKNPHAAREFIGFVLSPAGQAILARHGFGTP